MKTTSRNSKRLHRKRRTKAKMHGTAQRPRVAVFRSLRSISAQVIDDQKGKTILSASLKDVPAKERKNDKNGAEAVGKALAKKCSTKRITTLVFDRSGYNYHGKVKALADGLRSGGMKM